MGDQLDIGPDDDSPWARDVPVTAPVESRADAAWSRDVPAGDPHPPQFGATPAGTATPHIAGTVTPHTAGTATPHIAGTVTPHIAGTVTPDTAGFFSAPTSGEASAWESDARIDAPGPSGSEPTGRSRRLMWIGGAAVLVVLAIGAGSLLANRGDEPGAADQDQTGDNTLDSTVAPSTVPPSTVAPSTVAPSTVTPSTTPDATSGNTGAAPGTTTSGEVLGAPDDVVLPDVGPTWVDGTFDVPDEIVAAMDPNQTTTVVALSRDGILRELDLPSGDLREIEVEGSVFSLNQFVVGRSGVLLVRGSGGRSDGEALLYPSGGEPVALEGSLGSATFQHRPNSDDFDGFLFGAGPDDYRNIVVRGDGSVEQTPRSLDGGQVPWLNFFGPDGDGVEFTGGAIFERSDDGGVSLVARAELISISSHHYLIRECDDAGVCSDWLIDGVTGERAQVQLGSAYVSGGASMVATGVLQVAPDGTKAWFFDWADGGGGSIIDLATGDVTTVQETGGQSGFGAFGSQLWVWTADSSGVIVNRGASLHFIDAATGVSTPFASNLTASQAFGVRLDAAGIPEPRVADPLQTGIRLVGYSGDGAVHEIDIDSATWTTTDVEPLRSSAPLYVLPDASGVSVVSYDNVDGVRVVDGAVESLPPDAFGGLMLPGPTSDTVWMATDRTTAGYYELVDSLGRRPRTEIRLPTGAELPIGADGRGGIVSRSQINGIYAVGPDGVELLTEGRLLALSAGVVVARECNQVFECGPVVIDRTTGDRRQLEENVVTQPVSEPTSFDRLLGTTVSPNGEVALLFNDVRDEYFFYDLVTEEPVLVPTPDHESVVAWSDDGDHAVVLSDERLHVYDRIGASIRTLGRLPELRSIAVRSSAQPAGLVSVPAPMPS